MPKKKLTSFILRAIRKAKDSSFFIESDTQNYDNKESEFIDFDSFSKVSILPYYKDGITPYFYVILKNKKKILDNLIKKIYKEFNLYLKVGIELEFYLIPEKNNKKSIKTVLNYILKESKKENIKILDLEEERGKNQFEIKTYPESNLLTLANNIEKLKKIIRKSAQKNSFKVIFDAKPYTYDCGSALQLNISLHDIYGVNIFIRKFENEEFIETDKMLNCIGGLCNFAKKYSIFFSQKEEDFARYDININRFLHQSGKFVSPSNISWGVNNRTTAFRIPSPKFSSVREYEEIDKNRRIENRIPCANCDIYLALIGSMTGIYEGLKSKLIPIEKTFGNAYNSSDFEQISFKTVLNPSIFDVLFF